MARSISSEPAGQPEETDLVIVGGGPAGLSTALHLHQRDPRWTGRMLLLEKETHPREKLCGGGITRLGLETLSRLRLKPQIPLARVQSARFTYRGRQIDVRGDPMFLISRRAEFDHWLAEEARSRGIKLIENSPVISMETARRGLSGAGSICASVRRISPVCWKRSTRPWGAKPNTGRNSPVLISLLFGAAFRDTIGTSPA